MASLQKRVRSKGRSAWLIQFILNRRRRSVFLDSKYSKDLAKEVVGLIEKLVCAIETDSQLDKRTAMWLASSPDDLKKRLANAGLVSATEKKSIGEIADLFLSVTKSQIAEKTFRTKALALQTFVLALGRDRILEDIPLVELEKYFNEKDVAPATRASTIARVRSCFNWALKQGYISQNPLAEIKRGSMMNKEREYYVELQDFYQALEHIDSPDAKLALLFYRIGGLRGSEAMLVQWDDIDFVKKKILVHSPKTAKKGKATRTIPLFKELASELEKRRKREGFVLHITLKSVYREYKLALEKAGLKKHPRLIQNLRSSRAIEISRDFGIAVENEWLGHTKDVAISHYLHSTQDDFERATN